MLIGLAIRDVVLIETLDLAPGPGLTALTGETGAGKSIILDALGLALGARGEASLVRVGAAQAVVTAIFALPPDAPAWACLEERGLSFDPAEDLVLRRVVGVDGRSRAFVNDQAVGVGVLRELGQLLVEVHGQHQTVGLLDARTHGPLLDDVGSLEVLRNACRGAWSAWREAAAAVAALEQQAERAGAETLELSDLLAELDRLAPKAGEASALAQARAIMGAAEKVLGDVASAREHLDPEGLDARLGQAARALERAGQRIAQASEGLEGDLRRQLDAAVAAVDRTIVEAAEAAAAIDAAAQAMEFDPSELDRTEERLFALRAMGRRLGLDPDVLNDERARLAQRLAGLEDLGASLADARAAAAQAKQAYDAAAGELTAARRQAGDALTLAVQGELASLRLERARFEVAVEPLAEDRQGPAGADRIEFRIATVPGAAPQALGEIASGGELARIALALKVALAGGADEAQPLIIFDEIDQGVGGAVADAVGLRLRRLAGSAQVLVVTHSPQVAARAHAHWRVSKGADDGALRTAVDPLSASAREEEIARMLSGAQVTEAARAAARALIDA